MDYWKSQPNLHKEHNFIEIPATQSSPSNVSDGSRNGNRLDACASTEGVVSDVFY